MCFTPKAANQSLLRQGSSTRRSRGSVRSRATSWAPCCRHAGRHGKNVQFRPIPAANPSKNVATAPLTQSPLSITACALPSLAINDLPPALLARIFTLTDPRRDGLALLLTCRHWLGVAEAECSQHLWGSVVVHSDGERLLQQQAQAALLAGVTRRAACLAELRVVPGRTHTYPFGATGAALAPLWPVLLRAVEENTQLNVLEYDAAINGSDSTAFCEAMCSLTSLRQLAFNVHVPEAELPPPALRHLSALTRLERLELSLANCVCDLPADLLPALGSLTRLALELFGQQSVAWQLPDGSGPLLRQLELSECRLGMPPDRLLPALRQLERLKLYMVTLDEAQFSILPQLPHLTSLALDDMRVAWPAVLRCAMLRELSVGYPANPSPADLPPGSLPQLTRLMLDCAHALPAWLALPQLRSLEVGFERGPLPPGLGQCLLLEELVVSGHSLLEVTRAVASLTRLTRLEVSNYDLKQPLMLHEGPYLAGLRQLKTVSFGRTNFQTLPASLAAATSLELLDLGGYRALRLRGAEDAALLRVLPQLQRVLLPCRNGDKAAAAALERIREGLLVVTEVVAGPSHAVKVEGIMYG